MAGIQIPIEVVDKFSKQLSDLDSKMGTLTKAAEKQQSTFNLLSADIIIKYGERAGRAIFDFGEACLKSFGDSEKAASRLDMAIKNQGITAQGYSGYLQDQAKALQLVTVHSDEVIMETMTLLTTFGLAGKELSRANKAAMDLSSGLGIDLRTATLMVGKAWVGETGSLSRFGIKIDETLSSSQKFDAVMGQIQARFNGAAAAEARTYAGQVEILKNQFDELKEKIGSDLVGGAKQGEGALLSLTMVVNENYEAVKKFSLAVAQSAYSPTKAAGTLIDWYNNLESASERAYKAGLKARLQDVTAAVAGKVGSKGGANDDAAASRKKAKEAQDALDEEQANLNISATMKLASATMSNQELLALQDQLDAGMIEKQLGHDAAMEFMRGKDLQRTKLANAQKAQNMSDTLNMIATLSTAKNKELAAIGKAAAIGMAYINTSLAITKALASVPPPWNFALAAAVGAAGAAQVATIIGTPLAEGGIVKARSGGLQATIGEGGRDEAVIPLDDPRTRQRLAGALGGGSQGVSVNVGGITVTVQGNADKGIAARLAEEVRNETVDAIKLALRMSNLSQLNAGMAA